MTFYVDIELTEPRGDRSDFRFTGTLSGAMRSAILHLADKYPGDKEMQKLAQLIRYPRKQES